MVDAPSSTKNKEKRRDPEMHQTKKGNQWYIGMKAHIGIDAESGLVHSVIGYRRERGDVTQADRLLHGQEAYGIADAGYIGVEKRNDREHTEVIAPATKYRPPIRRKGGIYSVSQKATVDI